MVIIGVKQQKLVINDYFRHVKKPIKIVVIVKMMMLLCIGYISSASIIPPLTPSVSNTAPSEHVRTTAIQASDALCHTVQHESSVSVSKNGNSPGTRNTVSNTTTISIVTKQLTDHYFYQYRFYSGHLIARLQTPEIIFPYHYFW